MAATAPPALPGAWIAALVALRDRLGAKALANALPSLAALARLLQCSEKTLHLYRRKQPKPPPDPELKKLRQDNSRLQRENRQLRRHNEFLEFLNQTLRTLIGALTRSDSDRYHRFSPREKERLLLAAQDAKARFGIPFERFAALLQLHPRVLRRWRALYDPRLGVLSLAPRSRRPQRCLHRTPPSLQWAVVWAWRRCRHRNLSRFTAEFHEQFAWLLRLHGKTALHRTTIARLLTALGLYGPCPADPPPSTRGQFLYFAPMVQWIADTTDCIFRLGPWRLRLKLIAIMDAATRRVLGCRLLWRESASAITALLARTIARFGQPLLLLVDRGRPYQSRRLQRFLRTAGILSVSAHPYRPQTKGTLERWFATLKLLLASPLPLLVLPLLLRQTIFRPLFLGALRLWAALAVWVYHHTPQPSIDGLTPLQRWRRATPPPLPTRQEVMRQIRSKRSSASS